MLRAIRRMMLISSQYSRKLSRESGLTIPQLLCLRAIREVATEKSEVTAAQVAQRVGLAAATVSRILDRMERGNLIQRNRTSPDRRRLPIVLTEFGKQRLDNVAMPLQDKFVDRVAAMPPEEREGLLSALEKVVDMMEGDDFHLDSTVAETVDRDTSV